MKSIKLKAITIDNFKCFTHFGIEFSSHVTNISGCNASGKTSLIDAISWTLFNKMADGSSPDKIRPHNVNGEEINGVDITVEIEMLVDGVPMTIKKIQSQKWTKPRGSENAVFGGNENKYEINSVPMTEKAFNEKIAEIVNADVFRLSTIPGAFISLEQKKRRELLLNLADAKAIDIILREKYPDLYTQYLDNYTVEEATAIANKALKEKKKELESIPIRIDELVKQRVPGDIEALKNEAAEIRNLINTGYDDSIDLEIKSLEIKKRDYIFHKKVDLTNNKLDAQKNYNTIYDKSMQISGSITRTKLNLDTLKEKVKIMEADLEDTRKKYLEANSSEFNESDTCPTCGQKLPPEMINKAKANFEKEIETTLNKLTEHGNSVNEELKQLKSLITEKENKISALNVEMDKVMEDVLSAQAKLNQYSDETINTSYFDTEIEKLQLKKNENAIADITELQDKLNCIEQQISKILNNENIDNRISELNKQRTEVSQAIADSEKLKYLLEDFTRERTKLLTEEVNSYFKYVDWVLFETQINGGIKEVCNATIDGSIAGNGLNSGHTILANIDICNALQTAYDINAFIFVDNAESLSLGTKSLVAGSEKSQMIYLSVSDSALEVC